MMMPFQSDFCISASICLVTLLSTSVKSWSARLSYSSTQVCSQHADRNKEARGAVRSGKEIREELQPGVVSIEGESSCTLQT